MKKNDFLEKTWVLGFFRKWILTTPGVLVYHFHGTMQTIITSSLRPVCTQISDFEKWQENNDCNIENICGEVNYKSANIPLRVDQD